MAFATLLRGSDDHACKRVERCLLYVFLFSRALLYWRTFDDGVGWDAGDHLNMLDHWPWEPQVWGVRSQFYAFHPQLLFFLGRVLVVLGMHRDAAAQTICALSMLGVFFGMRWILRRLGLLHSVRGLATLYGGASLPVQVYLARSINLDASLQAAAVVSIAASIAMLQGAGRIAELALVTALVSAMLTKAPGVLLLAVPCIVYCVLVGVPSKASLRRFTMSALLPPLVACVLVAPYALARYVIPEGRLFITNMDMAEFDLDLLEADRERLHERGVLTFWKEFAWGSTPGSEPIDKRDALRVRMSNFWKDLWAANRDNIPQGGISFALSAFYAWAGSALLLWGAWRTFARSAPAWRACIRIFTAVALLYAAMLVSFTWRYPHPQGNPTKAVYIAPALLLLWFFVGATAPEQRRALVPMAVLLIAWTLLNAGLPVY